MITSFSLACLILSAGGQDKVALSHDDVRSAVQNFLSNDSSAKNIGFIRISGEGLAKKTVVAIPETDFVRYGPWQVNVATREALLDSKVALLDGTIVESRGVLTVKINRIVWLKR